MWKLCGNCAFPQNFRTRKLGQITVFYAVKGSLLAKVLPILYYHVLKSQQNKCELLGFFACKNMSKLLGSKLSGRKCSKPVKIAPIEKHNIRGKIFRCTRGILFSIHVTTSDVQVLLSQNHPDI